MVLSDAKIKTLLLDLGVVEEDKLESALKTAKRNKQSLADVLVDADLIKDEQIGQMMSEEMGYNFINLAQEKIDLHVLEQIPETVARSRGVIAFAGTDSVVKVAMLDPSDLEIKNFINKKTGKNVVVYYTTNKAFNEALNSYRPTLSNEIVDLLASIKNDKLTREETDETVVKIVDIILDYGYQSKSSDIHIEPYENKVLVRFRIDGVLHDVLEIPKSKEQFEAILTRLKIMAKMRTDEHRSAQDGKLRFQTDAELLDVRVSIVPVTKGEKVVMRLLSSKSRQFSLSSLGFSNRDLKKVEKAVKHPHGMILVTGPTGSGKTTSLYATMKLLNKRSVNIATIEDPVEYDIDGINQIQVNTRTKLTFAKGLRSIVRQDPDIIMVGEIRDEETADIAVNSAMTGHLVLSTLHTNDAATTLPRLVDMKVEPFLIASTVNIVIAQRLVRKICERCRVSYKLSDDDRKMIEADESIKALLKKFKKKDLSKLRLYKGAGCKVCGDTGYNGRIGVFEVLEMSEDIKNLILKNASSDEINAVAKDAGMTSMFEDGVEKVLNGLTTLDEVLRVSRD
jgi:type IV pilus assembly protein PilB